MALVAVVTFRKLARLHTSDAISVRCLQPTSVCGRASVLGCLRLWVGESVRDGVPVMVNCRRDHWRECVGVRHFVVGRVS
eukprot:5541919-Pleurochrysis_carterae.AAC.4